MNDEKKRNRMRNSILALEAVLAGISAAGCVVELIAPGSGMASPSVWAAASACASIRCILVVRAHGRMERERDLWKWACQQESENMVTMMKEYRNKTEENGNDKA